MLTPRYAHERGCFDHGWLKTAHTFSFSEYVDPRHMGFFCLRVINEDRVEPGQGFGTHGHRDMEIITYVLNGQLEHKDSMGNGSVIRPGEIQYMSAARGVTHSEFNHSSTHPVHFLQIWIVPAEKGGEPRYDQRHFTADQKQGRWCLLASRKGENGSVGLRQDARIYASCLSAQSSLSFVSSAVEPRVWVHVARGIVRLSGVSQEEAHVTAVTLGPGSGCAAVSEKTLQFVAQEDAEVLVFDLGV